MARKDKKEKEKEREREKETKMGFAKEEKEEALIAEGMKRVDMDTGRVELTDRNKKTPFIETYDERTGELEGKILLKDGNREGLLALVKIIEEVKVKQDHEAKVSSIGFNGKLNVENPSKKDRLWDIDITLKNIQSTNLKSDKIEIQELGTTDKDNVDSREFKITGEAKNLLLIKEFINTMPDADRVLNSRDLESELLKIKSSSVKAEQISEKEEKGEDEDEMDGGSEASSLESYGISFDKENTVTFAIAMRSLFEKPIKKIKVVKKIPDGFSSPTIKDYSIGKAEREGDTVVWTIDELKPETTVVLKFTSTIKVSSIETKKTGTIEVTYQAASSFAEGLAIDSFDAYTHNKFYVDIEERDEEPNVWDCKLVFDNCSEFIIELFNADVSDPKNESKKYVDVDPKDVPRLPSGAQWHSLYWQYESEEYPSFKKLLEFRAMPDFQTNVNGTIAISDVELAIASITGEMSYDITEVPTFATKEVNAILTLTNNGSAPLDTVSFIQQKFNSEYQPPKSDEIKMKWDGSEVELAGKAVSFRDNALRIELTDLKNSSTGMFEPKSTIEVQYPIHSVKPVKESKFESEVIYLANTYPLSQELEFRPDVPVITALHLRRKFRVGKEVLHVADLGQYKIILIVENIGDMPLTKLTLIDKAPDKFEYGNFSREPEITDEVGADTLKWSIDKLDEGQKIEISYELTGKGDYSPSDAQLAY